MAKKGYTVKNVRYVTTRRGVNAYAEIWLGTKKIGSVEDTAEAIVAPVFFENGAQRMAFLNMARKELPSEALTGGDGYAISEYARSLITAWENQREKKVL